MKRLFLLLIMLILIGCSTWNYSQAADFSLKDFSIRASGGIFYPMDRAIGDAKEFKAQVEYKNTFYLWGSYDNFRREIGGIETDPIEIYGVGFGIQNKILSSVGVKIPILKDITVWANLGYFIPTHFARERPYDHELSSSVGGSAGLSLEHRIIDGLFLGMNVGYQILKMRSELKVRDPEGNIFVDNLHHKDFQGISWGASLRYNF